MSILGRKEMQSAVASAAYQSGEKLFSEYDHLTKDYGHKDRIVFTTIMLPGNAPPEYADRQTLWNSAEAAEKQWNSQLVRKIRMAIPREVPTDQYPKMVQEFCRDFFVSKGMIADVAIHDDGDGNPHAHIMLTMRSMDEHGKWLPKSHKVYDLDENGERIRLPSGYWKSHKENTNDWNEQKNCEIWRQGWADIQNKYLEQNGRTERVDLRSYERQGIDKVPTVHMGPAVAAMERKGIQTDIGNLNRDIAAHNSAKAKLRSMIRSLMEWISNLEERIQTIKAEHAEAKEPTVVDLLSAYLEVRSDERSGWSSRSKVKGTAKDYNKIMAIIGQLKEKNIVTVADLKTHLENANAELSEYHKSEKHNNSRIKEVDNILASYGTLKKLWPVKEEYFGKKFKFIREKYAAAHGDELAAYDKAYKFLLKHGAEKTGSTLKVDVSALKKERAKLAAKNEQIAENIGAIYADLDDLKTVRYYISKVQPEYYSQLLMDGEKPSVKERMEIAEVKRNTQANAPHKFIKEDLRE